jgi:hypothetical protein
MGIMDDGKTYVELTIGYDEDCENPLEYTGWTHVDFRRGYGDDPRTIDDFFERDGVGGVRPHIGFRSKIKAGGTRGRTTRGARSAPSRASTPSTTGSPARATGSRSKGWTASPTRIRAAV